MKKSLLIIALLTTSIFYGQKTLFDGSTSAPVIFNNGKIQGPAGYETNSEMDVAMDDGTGNIVMDIIRKRKTLVWHQILVNVANAPLTGWAFSDKNTHISLRVRTTKNTDGTIELEAHNIKATKSASYIGNGDGNGGFGPWQTIVFDFSGESKKWNTRFNLFFDGTSTYSKAEGFQVDDVVLGDSSLKMKKK